MQLTTQEYVKNADLTDLEDHPDNAAHHGDDNTVANSVDVNGFYGAILVQKSTGYILAGHTRRRVLLAAGQTTGPVIYVDCDDVTARRILLADNRTNELSTWDDQALLEVLESISMETEPDGSDPLAGTGFSMDLLAGLRSDLTIEQIQPPTEEQDRGSEMRDRADRYENTELRQIMLVMQREDYDKLIPALDKLRAEFGLDTYAAVVQRLVLDAVGEPETEDA